MSICDTCINYEYDEDYECYTCMMDLDEDEYEKFITGRNTSCPQNHTYNNKKRGLFL